jgi:hypothetical protein
MVAGYVVDINAERLRLAPSAAAGDGKSVANAVEEFVLVRPVPGISPGDRVRVRFHDENGRHVALSVEELHSRQ